MKPENLLLDHAHNIKIVDFGLSNTYKGDEKLKTACGSPCYAAPEMIAGKKYVGLQVDIWSSGVVLFALLCGYLPFEDPNTSSLYKKILGGDFTIPKHVSGHARDLLKGILNTDPQKRLTIAQIRAHHWLQLAPLKPRQGIISGLHQVPVDGVILKQIEKYGFDCNYARKCLEASKHNSITTTYYLLLEKHIREGGLSDADLSSDSFEPQTISKRLHTLRDSSNPRREPTQPCPPVPTSTTTPVLVPRLPQGERKTAHEGPGQKNRKYVPASDTRYIRSFMP